MPPLDRTVLHDHLAALRFSELFTQDMGWDWPVGASANPFPITLDGRVFEFRTVAHKRGVGVLHCVPRDSDPLPPPSLRGRLEREVAKKIHEHIIIFTDAANTVQVWQTALRRAGQPIRRSEYTLHLAAGATGEPLAQRLDRLAFTLDEEELLTLPDVLERMQESGLHAERITKRFYQEFASQKKVFTEFIEGLALAGDRSWYASVMLNRLMFVWFIQAKSFLDQNPNYLPEKLKQVRAAAGPGHFHNFYRQFLLRLFHEGLGARTADRAPDLSALIGQVPYLNGGLFDVHELERGDTGSAIRIPDEAFERLFAFFGQWRWHLDERPLRDDREVNPDVLGYIFEKYINQKEMGAYYTKEDITGYISRNCIVPCLFSKAETTMPRDEREAFITYRRGLLKENPDRYIYAAVRHGAEKPLPPEIAAGESNVALRTGWNRPAPAEFALPTEWWREVVTRRRRYAEVKAKLAAGEVRELADLVTLNLDIVQLAQDAVEDCPTPAALRALWDGLADLSVLDPTCGSGAFLFAALNILQPLYDTCLRRMEALVDEAPKPLHPKSHLKFFAGTLDDAGCSAHPSRAYYILKRIILGNLYGVDLMPEAVEICKLRLFLKLVAQVTPDPAKDNLGVEPLPDVDFNVRPGNTLVGFATRAELERSAEGDYLRQQEIATAIQAADDAAHVFDTFRQSQLAGDTSGPMAVKTDLRARLQALRDQLDRYLARVYDQRMAEDDRRFAKWKASHHPFHWLVEFYAIVSSGGFDVIIGNPPYVEYSRSGVEYRVPALVTAECDNLWAFVLERALGLLSDGGRMSLITPLSLVSTKRFASAYQLLASSARCATFLTLSGDAHPSVLFSGVKMSYTIFTYERAVQLGTHRQLFISKLYRWLASEREGLFSVVEYQQALPLSKIGIPFKVGTALAASVLGKVVLPPLTTIAHFERKGGFPMLYHRIVRHFVKALFSAPFFRNERDGEKRSEDYKSVFFEERETGKLIRSFLVSSTYYLFFVALSDAYHCGRDLVLAFPVGIDRLPKDIRSQLVAFGVRHERDLYTNSVRRRIKYEATGWIEYDEFYPRESKSIADEIDRVLARHYGFTDEELDFIINYDLKYRLGREAEIEEE